MVLATLYFLAMYVVALSTLALTATGTISQSMEPQYQSHVKSVVNISRIRIVATHI